MPDEIVWKPHGEGEVCAKKVPTPQSSCPMDKPPGSAPDLRPENRDFGHWGPADRAHLCILSCEVDAHCPMGGSCKKPADGMPSEDGAFCSYPL